MKRILIAAAVLSLLLAGCDFFKRGTGMSNEHPVVSVTNGTITVSPDPITFRSRGAVVIVWSLDDSAAAFKFDDARGISVADTKGEFDDQRVIAQGRKFQVRNKNSIAGRYKYTINLRGPNGPVSLDPLIVNAE